MRHDWAEQATYLPEPCGVMPSGAALVPGNGECPHQFWSGLEMIRRRIARDTLATAALAVLVGCGGARGPEGDNGAARPLPPMRPAAASAAGTMSPGSLLPIDAVRLYQSMGLLADGPPVPFVGSVVFLGGRSPDSTLALVTLSIPNRSLTFSREGDRYQASYQASVEVRRAGALLARTEGTEQVRVAVFKETARSDESIIFQQVLVVPPGSGDLTVTVRDELSGKGSSSSRPIVIPRFDARSLSSPVPFYEVTLRTNTDSLPRLVASPRATIVFGRDSVVPLYIEGYGAGDRLAVTAAAYGEGSTKLWSDTLTLVRRGRLMSGVVRVPSSPLGIGVARVSVRRSDTGDTASTPVFISFGEDLPVATYEQMVSYLRYFASPGRLRRLESAAPDQRALVWGEFAKEMSTGTGPSGLLQAYFLRIESANLRFRDEGTPGWLTDRGMVYITLGEPDQLREPTAMDMNQRGRVQIWDYNAKRLQLVFVDQTGFGRWRLTPASMADFQSVARSVQEQGSR